MKKILAIIIVFCLAIPFARAQSIHPSQRVEYERPAGADFKTLSLFRQALKKKPGIPPGVEGTASRYKLLLEDQVTVTYEGNLFKWTNEGRLEIGSCTIPCKLWIASMP